MVAGRKWQFTARFRAKAYGWRGSRLAISRLKEAVSEIKAAAKSDPVAAGSGAVSLMERIWPAFQDIDTSSGALGMAVAHTLAELIPILIDAPADYATRSKWLERLFEAVQNDGGRISGPGRRPVGRDRPLSGSDQRICGPPYRDGSTRLGRSCNIPACDRDIHLPVILARSRTLR
jgi:hypothetical protein